MGEIVPISKQNAQGEGSLALTTVGQAPLAQGTYEERIEAAQELEKKLKHIQETVPTKVYNVSSSSAGAGSGDFHQYRIVRRAEQDRVRQLEADWAKKQEEDEFKRKMEELKKQAEERTAKKRLKRLKKKNNKKQKVSNGSSAAGEQQAEGSEDESEDGAVQAALD